MKVSPNPRDYNLPFDSWLPGQHRVAECVADLEQDDVLVLESPTGTGKSGYPAFLSQLRRVTVLVASRDLQQQYADSFPWFAVVWGQAHYPCIEPGRVERYRKAYDEVPTYADCWSPSDCPVRLDCPYELAKFRASKASARVLNYAYAFHAHWWQSDPGVVFCDEAHSLPGVLADLVSFQISEHEARLWKLPDFPHVVGSSTTVLRQACAYLDRVLAVTSKLEPQDERARHRLWLFTGRLDRLMLNLNGAEEDTWYIASGISLRSFSARPVFPGRYAPWILPRSASGLVLMSATIGDPRALLSELGLGGQFRFMSLPHPFPRERRPVFFLSRSPALSQNAGAEAYHQQAALIANILRQHRGQKGIIHTASWSHARLLAGLLGREFGDRIMLAEGERVTAVRRFREAQEAVAVSPSWHHGLNFPDDQARFCVVAKIPFPSLADPINVLRLRSPGGRKWYDWNACLQVVQAAGRIVRHADDWGVTYIVDGNWRRVARLAPAWFEVIEV